MTAITRLDVAAFKELGYLQEVNRLVLHPCGLALEVFDDDGSMRFGGVWDYRSDDEGIVFSERPNLAKIATVITERDRHASARIRLMGSVVQPFDYPRVVATESPLGASP